MQTPDLRILASNLTEVSINECDFYFSYSTCVAVRCSLGLVVSQNVWSTTTGKHLNKIDGGSKDAKAQRRPHDVFEAILRGLNV